MFDVLVLICCLYLGVGVGFAVGWTAYGHIAVDPAVRRWPWSRRLLEFPRALLIWPPRWWRWVGVVFRR